MNRDIANKIIGFAGGTLIVISLIPQLVEIVVNKSSENVSIIMYWILLIAQCLWTLYGILNHDLQISVSNIAAGILTIMIISSAYYFSINKN